MVTWKYWFNWYSISKKYFCSGVHISNMISENACWNCYLSLSCSLTDKPVVLKAISFSNTARFYISLLILSNMTKTMNKQVFHNKYILLELKCLLDTFSLSNNFKSVNFPIICSLQVFHRKSTKDNSILYYQK